MAIPVEDRNRMVKELLNGTYQSLKNVVPMQHEMKSPTLLQNALLLQYGVLIGITGDISGKLILAGDSSVFANIGEVMFGMALEGDMLASFSGELGNMIAGSLSTIIVNVGIQTDITAPTIIEGQTRLSGFERAIQIPVNIDGAGELDIFLLID